MDKINLFEKGFILTHNSRYNVTGKLYLQELEATSHIASTVMKQKTVSTFSGQHIFAMYTAQDPLFRD